MKPTFGKLSMLLLLVTFLAVSTVSPIAAQAPEQEGITDGEGILADPSLFEQTIAERRIATVDGGGNSINAVTTWWSSSGTTFVPAASTTTYNYGGAGCVDTSASLDVWRGQVNLPHGSTISGMWFNYSNEVTDPIDSTIYLRRYSYTGSYDDILMINGGTTGLGNHTSYANAAAFQMVDNFAYAYVLVWIGRTDQNLCGVNLGFQAPPIYLSALPMIKR